MPKHVNFLFLIFCFSISCNSQKNALDQQGRRNGPWKINFESTDHPKFEGNYLHGKEVGSFKYYKKGFYDHPAAILDYNEKNDSVLVTYYTQTGKPISKGKMVNKMREGEWLYYHHKSDSIMMTEFYKNDTLHGWQKTYYPSGKLAEKTKYTNGNKDGVSFIYAENGTVVKELNFKHGKLHGAACYYNSKGEKEMEGQFNEGNKTGLWKYYRDGKLEKEEDY